jgi:GNAT superfamily N-acetyltransferase
MRVVDSGLNVSISAWVREESAGCVDADLMVSTDAPPYWWLARCKVYLKHRRKGVGRQMLGLLAQTVKGRGFPVVVAPGGYDITQKEQRAFYRACGFVDQADGTMRLEVA